MKRLLVGGGLGVVLGSLATLLIAALLASGDGPVWAMGPLRLEFELGERAAAAVPLPAEATPIAASLSPSLNAIAEQRATSGSLLAGTLLAATDSTSESEEFASALVRIAHEEEVNDLAAPPAPEPPPEPEGEPVTDVPTGVAASLETTAQQLYALATEREQAMEFVRADQFRRLARRLRMESVEIQQEQHQADSRNLSPRPWGLLAPEQANPEQSANDAN